MKNRGRGSLQTEVWRSCSTPGLSNYAVSSSGRVRRVTRGKTWGPRILRCERRAHLVRDDGTKGYFTVARLVAWAFWRPPPTLKHEAAHNDGNDSNNHYKNIRWATRKENHADMQIHGTAVKGTRNGRAKLSEAQVCQIRRDVAAAQINGKLPYGVNAAIARKYDITGNTLTDIIQRRRWRHI